MISGKKDAVEKALALSLEEGALKAFCFNTGVAYHHPVMKKYSQEYNDFCGSIKYNDPRFPILSIFDNTVMTTGDEIMRENQLNVYTPIRWDLSIKKLEDMGVKEFFDISANGAVSKFSRVARKCKIYTLEDVYA